VIKMDVWRSRRSLYSFLPTLLLTKKGAPLTLPRQLSLSTILMDIPFFQAGASRLDHASGTSLSPRRSQPPPGCGLRHIAAGNHPVTTTACSATILWHPSALAFPSTHSTTRASTSQPRNPCHQLYWSGLCSLLTSTVQPRR
jgi:hypothetical protein